MIENFPEELSDPEIRDVVLQVLTRLDYKQLVALYKVLQQEIHETLKKKYPAQKSLKKEEPKLSKESASQLIEEFKKQYQQYYPVVEANSISAKDIKPGKLIVDGHVAFETLTPWVSGQYTLEANSEDLAPEDVLKTWGAWPVSSTVTFKISDDQFPNHQVDYALSVCEKLNQKFGAQYDYAISGEVKNGEKYYTRITYKKFGDELVFGFVADTGAVYGAVNSFKPKTVTSWNVSSPHKLAVFMDWADEKGDFLLHKAPF